MSEPRKTLRQTLDETAGRYLRELIAEASSVKEVARIAGINRTHVFKVLKRYGVTERPANSPRSHRGTWRGLGRSVTE